MLTIILREMHFFMSSFNSSASARHHIIPVIRHTILWKETPGKNGDDASLIIKYSIRCSMEQSISFVYRML